MIIKEKASTAGLFPTLIPVYMILVCLKFEHLIFSNLTALSMTFYSQHTFRHNQILARLLTMTSTHINTAGLNFDPIHFYKACIFIRQAGPDTVLSFQFLGRKQFFRCHETTVYSRRLDQFLEFDSKTAGDLSKYSKLWISRSSFNLCQHTFADASLFCCLIQAHTF